MIIVTATLNHRESLGAVTISNDGTGTSSRGNYDVKMYSRGKKPRVIRRARIEHWPRNAKTAMDLVITAYKALEK